MKRLLCLGMLFVLACKKDPIAPTGIQVVPTSLLTFVGGTDSLLASKIPINAAGNIAWSSDDPSVARVNASGVVTGVGAGVTVIRATTGHDISAACTVTVKKWTTYNRANSGLASDSSIYALAVDKQGNIWVGTDGGLFEFNGNDWANYTPANSGLTGYKVVAIAIDSLGNKWLGTDAKLCRFDGTAWTSYNVQGVTSLAVDIHGNLWSANWDTQVAEFDGTNWTYHTPYDSTNTFWISTVGTDHQGNIWLGTEIAATIWKFDGAAWTTYDIYHDQLGGASVYAIASDAQSDMWFGFAYDGGGVSEFDGTNWITYNAPSDRRDFGIGVKAIAVDGAGNKWFGSEGNGASVFDGASWTTYDMNNSALRSNYIWAIAVDKQGNTWFGTYGGGGLSVLYAP
jgi:ligand-binding sensor domain-containing protein